MAKGKNERAAPSGCYWRGDTLWGQIRRAGRKPIRWSLETDDWKLAEARYKERKDRIVADKFGDAVRTFLEVAQGWKPWITRRVGERTVERYICSLDQMTEWLENKNLCDIDGRLVAEIIRARTEQRVTNATIKRDLVALSSVMNYAIDQGWIEYNPVLVRMKRVKEKRDPIILPREEDIALVTSRAPGMIADMIRAACKTGARESELLRSRRGDVNRKDNGWLLHGKKNKKRTIDTKAFGVVDFLDGLPVCFGKGKNPLLFWHSDGESYKNFASQFRDIIRRTIVWAKEQGVDFEPFRFHDLRHWHAIAYLRAKAGSIYDLQHRLGHVSVKTTEGYLTAGYLTPDQIEAAKKAAPTAVPGARA